MKIYIDFEASEEKQKIISVGCIKENGDKFYSLVNTSDPITARIEELTGICQEEIDNAPSIEKVFEDLFDWSGSELDNPEFICYGDGDFDFVNNTFYDAKSLKAASMLGYIYLNMFDCSDEIKTHFYVNKTISLEKLAKYFDPNLIEQNHNALEDAKLLKMVYEGIKKGINTTKVFNEYLDPNKYPDQVKKVVQLKGDSIVNEFNNIKEAVEWLKKQPNNKGPQYLKDADLKIKRAATTSGKYFDSNWRII